MTNEATAEYLRRMMVGRRMAPFERAFVWPSTKYGLKKWYCGPQVKTDSGWWTASYFTFDKKDLAIAKAAELVLLGYVRAWAEK